MNLFILSDYLCARSVDVEWWIFHLMLGSPVIKACRDLGIQINKCVLSSVNNFSHDDKKRQHSVADFCNMQVKAWPHYPCFCVRLIINFIMQTLQEKVWSRLVLLEFKTIMKYSIRYRNKSIFFMKHHYDTFFMLRRFHYQKNKTKSHILKRR